MIRGDEFQKFEMDLTQRERIDIRRNFRIVESLYEEAVALGALPLKDPLEGLEVDMRIARVVNRVSETA